AGDILKDRAIIEERNFVPLNPISKINEKLDLQPASTLYDLLSAFSDVLKAKQVESFHQVETEEISIEDRINYIMLYLKEREYATFQELFSDLPKKIVAVVTFMALLELARSKRIAIRQAKPFSELRIYRGEDYEGVPLDINMMNVVTVE
ncbi:MAG: segregation and condensation protein A, partial [Candidatus Zixiibacteriota bacterium]